MDPDVLHSHDHQGLHLPTAPAHRRVAQAHQAIVGHDCFSSSLECRLDTAVHLSMHTSGCILGPRESQNGQVLLEGAGGEDHNLASQYGLPRPDLPHARQLTMLHSHINHIGLHPGTLSNHHTTSSAHLFEAEGSAVPPNGSRTTVSLSNLSQPSLFTNGKWLTKIYHQHSRSMHSPHSRQLAERLE